MTMSKAKVTLSLDQTLLGAVDEAVQHDIADSRSAAVEDALRLWTVERQRQRLEREVEAYYRAQTRLERREDRAWTTLAGRQARRLWEG